MVMKKFALIALSIICIITLSGFGADTDRIYSRYTQLPPCPNENPCNTQNSNSNPQDCSKACDSCCNGINNCGQEIVGYTISPRQSPCNNSYVQYYPQLPQNVCDQNICDQNDHCTQIPCLQNQGCCSWHGAGVCTYSSDQIPCSDGSCCAGTLNPPCRCS